MHAAGLTAACMLDVEDVAGRKAAAIPGIETTPDAPKAGWYDRPMRWA